MDLRLYTRVLWRFKWIVLLGVLIAVALAGLSVVRVTENGVRYRQAELWSSTTRLAVTQKGFPWGRLLAQEPTAGEEADRLGVPIADPNRLNGLAVLYAELATSDEVRRQLLEDGPLNGKVVAVPVVVGDSRIMLPFVDVTAIATTPRGARRLAQRTADAFRIFIARQQQANRVPVADRVVVEQLVRPKRAKVFQPRSRTMPVVVFLAVLFGTIGLAFLLENLRPQGPTAIASPERMDAVRRTA